MRRLSFSHTLPCLVGALVILGLSPSPGFAAPKRATVVVEDGMLPEESWTDCAPRTLTAATRAPNGATTIPAAGEASEDGRFVVQSATVADGVASWTVWPTPDACSELTSGDEDSLELEGRTLRVRYTTRRYVLRAGTRTGVQRIAGIRTTWNRSYAPDVRAARRVLGRPSKTLPGAGGERRTVCAMRWNRIGLKIHFVNWGGRNACKHGFVQAAEITKPRLWAVVVGDRPGIVETSQPWYLEARGRTVESEEGWGLSEVYIPWGDPGYYPSIVAFGNERITRYEAWIGAGGD